MKTVLVVDDEYALAETLRDVLELEGYRVRTAENGVDALDWMSREKPDLVMLDVMMPVMDGIETLKRMRSDDALHEVPVLLMSAVPQVALDAIDENDVSGFLRKPFELQLLLDEVQRLTDE